jgi:CO dehydrogenase/acetyl-CoA synthase beta subunit
MKVTGSITVSIEPSNEDGGAAAAAADDCGSILVDVLLKSLVNDAVKKYVREEGVATIGDGDGDEVEDLSSPLPKRRIPANADDSVEEEEELASVEEEEEEEEEEASVEEEEDEAGDLPNVQVEYQYADDNSLNRTMYHHCHYLFFN